MSVGHTRPLLVDTLTVLDARHHQHKPHPVMCLPAEYDAQGANGYVASVSADHLPGALVLLQESGYSQLVLSLGAQWLTHNRQDVRRRDVTAAMALAHHTLAVQGLQQEAGCMLEACRHLESALLLIRQSLMGSEHAAATLDLQRDVMQLLKVGADSREQRQQHTALQPQQRAKCMHLNMAAQDAHTASSIAPQSVQGLCLSDCSCQASPTMMPPPLLLLCRTTALTTAWRCWRCPWTTPSGPGATRCCASCCGSCLTSCHPWVVLTRTISLQLQDHC